MEKKCRWEEINKTFSMSSEFDKIEKGILKNTFQGQQ